jgi:hypothetical protein
MTITLSLEDFFFVEEVFAEILCLDIVTVMMRVTVRSIGWVMVVKRVLADFTCYFL